MPRKPKKGQSLADLYPSLSKEWDTDKNGELTAFDIMKGATLKVWWKCKQRHTWKDSPNHRTSSNRGCPYCSGKRVSKKNSLVINFPKLIKELHPIKNKSIDISSISFASHKKLWWKCKREHEWEASVANRTKGRNCPHCNTQVSRNELRIFSELKYLFPDTLLKEKIDKVECDIFIPSVCVGIEYDGFYWHKESHERDLRKNHFLEEKKIKLIRVREVGLEKIKDWDIIFDSKKDKLKKIINQLALEISVKDIDMVDLSHYTNKNQFINTKLYTSLLERLPSPQYRYSLEAMYPELTKEWNFNKNRGLLPSDVSSKSSLKVWWKCNEGHEWSAMISNRSDKGNNCPYCAHQWITKENSLSFNRPDVANEWNYNKNGSLKPSDVFNQSSKNVWWICKEGHEWEAMISNRAGLGKNKNTKCPYCSGKKVCSDNSLATTNPKLAKKWDFKRNLSLSPDNITEGSNKIVWWLCEKKHAFQAMVIHMRDGRIKCPECKKLKSLRALKPEYLVNWDYEKNSKIDSSTIAIGSKKLATWTCSVGHNWQQKIYSRLKKPENYCPICISLMVLRPDLSKEWLHESNYPLSPDEVTLKSKKIVWWKCDKGHEWQERILNRTKKLNPKCKICK